jgi:hypothetical protein
MDGAFEDKRLGFSKHTHKGVLATKWQLDIALLLVWPVSGMLSTVASSVLGLPPRPSPPQSPHLKLALDFSDGQHIRHNLAGVVVVCQPVDDRHGGILGKLNEVIVAKQPRHDDIIVAGQHAGNILCWFALAYLQQPGRSHRVAAVQEEEPGSTGMHESATRTWMQGALPPQVSSHVKT